MRIVVKSINVFYLPVFRVFDTHTHWFIFMNSVLQERGLCALEDTAIAMVLYDESANIIFANRAFTELVGHTAEQLLKLNISDLDQGQTREELIANLNDETADRFETRVKPRSGDPVFVEVVSKSHLHDGEKFYSAFVLDISDRKRMEFELEKTQLAIENAADAISLYQGDGTCVYVNKRFCSWLGYKREEVIGLPCHTFIPDMTQDHADELLKFCEREGSVQFETTKVASDGTLYPVEIDGYSYDVGGETMFCAYARDISELKNSRMQLRLNQFGVDHSPEAVLWLKPNGNVTYANKAAAKFFGMTRSALVSLTLFDLEPELDQLGWQSRLENSKKQSPYCLESRLASKDGEPFDAALHFSLLNFGEELLLLSIKDITQSKLENKSLRQTRFVIDQFSDAIVLLNEQCIVVDVNEAHCQRLGYDKDELVGKSLGLFDKTFCAKQEDASEGVQEFACFENIESEQGRFYESIHVAKDGTEIHVQIRSTKTVVDGEALICSVIRDVTQQKLGQEYTETQLKLVRQTVERSIDAMFWHDESGKFIYVNKRACESLGYSNEELLKLSVADVDDQFEKPSQVPVNKMGAEKTSWVFESKHRRKDGTLFPVEISVAQLSSGKEMIYVAVVRDKTEMKAQEKRLSELSSQVAHLDRVGSMGQMASAIAHELNQPLSAISNYAYVLKSMLENHETVGEAEVQMANDICDQAIMSGEIVHRLRGFTTNHAQHRERCELNQIVVDSAKLMELRLRHSGIGIQVFLADDLPKINVDRIQLQQVVVNLLVNALEAIEVSESCSHTIIARTQFDKAKGVVRIEIEDSGVGVTDEIAESLFEPFRSTKSAGMGMGLAISSTIVNNHQGNLDYTTGPKGSTFFVDLPIDAPVASLL